MGSGNHGMIFGKSHISDILFSSQINSHREVKEYQRCGMIGAKSGNHGMIFGKSHIFDIRFPSQIYDQENS